MHTGNRIKEYHELFEISECMGSVRIQVRIKDFDGWYPDKLVEPEELCKLIDPDANGFLKYMSFDENPCEIVKYEVLPKSSRIIIHARMISWEKYWEGK